VRQKRRNGDEVYDLKAVCKIRDPWPQPWIKVKSRRGLSGLIESKVSSSSSRHITLKWRHLDVVTTSKW